MIEKKFKNVGRRKCAVALTKLVKGSGIIIINNKNALDYLQYNPTFINIIKSPLVALGIEEIYDVYVKVKGGGISGQADAICLSISRTIYLHIEGVDFNKLRLNGFLTRDSRCKERKSVSSLFF
jgi:small subunit ribosomal protein S9